MKKKYVDREEILMLAKLSALELSDDLIREYENSLNDVIHTMEASISMEVSDVDEMSSLHVMCPDDLREDLVVQDFSREEFLVNVPEKLGGLVKVPTVIK